MIHYLHIVFGCELISRSAYRPSAGAGALIALACLPGTTRPTREAEASHCGKRRKRRVHRRPLRPGRTLSTHGGNRFHQEGCQSGFC